MLKDTPDAFKTLATEAEEHLNMLWANTNNEECWKVVISFTWMMYVALFKGRVELADPDCRLLDWGKSLRAKLEKLTNRQEDFHASSQASAPSPDERDVGPGNRGPSVHSVSDGLETATARAKDRAPAVGQNKKMDAGSGEWR